MNIKCIGCFELKREEMKVSGINIIVYDCLQEHFPYHCALSGLVRPGKGILEGIKSCKEEPLSCCAICQGPAYVQYGDDIAGCCREHDEAWGDWLDEHQDRREHLSPRSRVIHANWVEVFREFVEDMRSSQD